MNILVISYCFLPWLAPRSIQESRILGAIADKGNKVTIVQRTLDKLDVPLDYELSGLVHPAISTIEIEEPTATGWRVAKRVFPPLGNMPDPANIWAIGAAKKALSLIHDHSVLITFSTPVSDHLAGLIVKRKNRSMPWAVFFSDPFVQNPYISMSPIERSLNAHLERSIMEHADAVIFVNGVTRDRTMIGYPSLWYKKTHVIPHAFDDALYPKKEQSRDKRLTIRYMGDFYGRRTPESLFKALRVVSNTSREFIVEIYGQIDDDMKSLITRYGLDEMVKPRGRISYLKNLSLMRTSDVLLTIDAPGTTSLFLPSKLIDYLGAGRPILAITSPVGPTADIVREMGSQPLGHDDTQGIADRILSYIVQKAKGRLEMTVPEEVLNRYRAQNVGSRYMKVLEGIVNL